MAKVTQYVLLFATMIQLCAAYKLLLVFPLPGKSSNLLGRAYVRHLLDAGHEVTYVTPFPTNKTTDTYHEVDLSKNMEWFEKQFTRFTLKDIIEKTVEMDMLSLVPKIIQSLKVTLENENLMNFLGDTTQQFDAVILEWSFTDLFSGLASVYNCPLIWFTSTEPHWMVLKLIHESSNPAFNPDIMSTAAPPFSFTERVKSLLSQTVLTALKYFYLEPRERVIFEEYFGPFVAMRGRKLPSYEEALYNGTFLLTISHPSLGQSISVPPNAKEISGYHIDPKTQPLSADLQKLMDEAKDGVIYFSMGSNANSKEFPDEMKQDFLKVFSSLKQTVLWKFEEKFENLPSNVHVLEWAPQQSILAHPNMRLFITHGGLLSTTEAVFFGVPTVVMPYGLDQYLNAERAVNKGFAIKVELSYDMADEFKSAINEILSNPKYTQRIKELSMIYHDRPVSPAKESVHWVEHVIRTGGAPHLRSPALLAPWYQKLYLDLLALVLVVLYVIKVVIKIIYRLGKKVLRLDASKSKKKSD